MTKFEPKKFLKINYYEKLTKKEERKKKVQSASFGTSESDGFEPNPKHGRKSQRNIKLNFNSFSILMNLHLIRN